MRNLAHPVYQVSGDLIGRAPRLQIASMLSLSLMGNNTVKNDTLMVCEIVYLLYEYYVEHCALLEVYFKNTQWFSF
jgi:hypothetical protein